MNSKSFIRSRLSILMFLQVFVFGITSPIMSLYLIKCLNFTGSQAGVVLSISGITSIISPTIGIFIADKLISVERLVGICHILASAFMLILSFQTGFTAVLLFYMLYMLVLGCTSSFVTAIVFHHAEDARKSFGGIRMWGSIGWVSAAWIFSYIWLRGADGPTAFARLGDALKVSSGVSLLVAFYTFTLPKSHIDVKKGKSVFPIEALKVIAKPRLILLCILIFLVSAAYQYYSFGLAPFLQQSGYRQSDIMPLMSIGQVSEVIALSLLGFFLARFNYKTILAWGLVFNLWRFIALSLGSSVPMVLSGILCHGLYFAFFSIAVSIYFDSQCVAQARSGVQQIIGIVSSGFGTFFGNLFAGQTITRFQTSSSYLGFWLVPAVINVVLLLVLLVFFKEETSLKEV